MSNSSSNQQRQNPFGSRPSGSALPGRSSGSSSSPFSRSNQQQNSSSSSSSSSSGSSSRFSGFRSRFGSNNQEIEWTIQPLQRTAVCFRLEGLGDPFHRLLGTELNIDYGDPQNAVKALQEDAELHNSLAEILEIAWEQYDLTGAVLVYPFTDTVRKAYINAPKPDDPPPRRPKKSGDDEEDDETEDEDNKPEQPPQKYAECLRALDLALVINVLARVRSNIVVNGTPLALEPGFLDQAFICDDPRVVALARATGCIEEAW